MQFATYFMKVSKQFDTLKSKYINLNFPFFFVDLQYNF